MTNQGRTASSNAMQIRRNRPQAAHIGSETTELATIDLKPVEEKPNRAAGPTPASNLCCNHTDTQQWLVP